MLGLMDCCRKHMDIPKPITRGPDGVIQDADDDIAEGQLCLVFACKPDKGTNADSTMIRQVFDRFRLVADQENGKFNLTEAF